MVDLSEIRAWKKKWGYDDDGFELASRQGRFRQDDPRKLPERWQEALIDLDQQITMRRNFAQRMRDAGKFDKAQKAEDQLAKLVDDRGPDPYDPMAQPLAKSIAQRVLARATIDRTAAHDQIADKVYTTDRRQELVDLTKTGVGPLKDGHYLAKEYALRTINDMNSLEARSGIRVDNELSSTYQRDAMSPELIKMMKTLYNAKKKDKLDNRTFSGNTTFFVNCDEETLKKKLNQVYTDDWKDPLEGDTYKPFFRDVKPLGDGLFVLFMTKEKPGVAVTDPDIPISNKQSANFHHRLLEGTGSTPSSYKIVKACDPSGGVDPLTHPDMQYPLPQDNQGALARSADSPGCKSLANLPTDHPLATTAGAASKMVTGLRDTLAKKLGPKAADFDKNKLCKSALEKIDRLMEVMPAYTNDIPRFSRLFDLLVDEVYLVLATVKPYEKDDFRASSKAMMDERIPEAAKIEGVEHKTFMLSSGMGTMSAAVEAAFSLTGNRKLTLIDKNETTSHSANYFEVEVNLVGQATMGDAEVGLGPPPVIMGTLNPSTPVREVGKDKDQSWGVEKLIAEMETALTPHLAHLTADRPAVAIIDITVEKEAEDPADQEINKIVVKFKDLLGAQKLQLMLCKSYQKYPSLGAGKAMAGGLTVLGKGPNAEALGTSVATQETAEGIVGSEEAQIVAHFVEHERDAERAMLTRAAKNASFVKGFMPPDAKVAKPAVTTYDEGLPFIVFDATPIPFDGQPVALKPQWLLYPMGVEKRMSFGFQNSSALGIGRDDDQMRLGCGQESEGELVEKLYAFTRVATGPRDVPVTAKAVSKIAGEAGKTGFAEARTALDANKDPAAWRKTVLQVLGKAGLLPPKEAPKTGAKDTPPVEISDSDLTGILNGLALGDDEAQLPKRLKLIVAMQAPKVTDEAFTLSTTLLPDGQPDARIEWREKSVALLLRRDALKASEVTRTDGAITAPDDNTLRMKLRELDDANLMKDSVASGWLTGDAPPRSPEAAFLPEIVASTALMIANAFDKPPATAEFNALADAVIDSGLDQLSNECRARLLDARISSVIAGGSDTILADLARIETCADAMPYEEGSANILLSAELAAQLKKKPVSDLPPDAKTASDLDKLAAALSKSLKLASHADLVEKLTASAVHGRAEAPTLRQTATEKREAANTANLKTKEDKERRAARAEEEADAMEALAEAHPKLAKATARQLAAKLATADKAFVTPARILDTPPEAPTAPRDFASTGRGTAPQPLAKDDYDKIKLRCETLIDAATRL